MITAGIHFKPMQQICGKNHCIPMESAANHYETRDLSLPFYPPKLSYMIDSGSTPRLSSMATTAFDIGPGPHM